MTDAALRPPPSAADMSVGQLARAYVLEARSEFVRMWRSPAFVLPSLMIPLMFFGGYAWLFSSGQEDASRRILVSCLAFGAMSPGLFGFGGAIAIERSQGVMLLKRAMPMPPGAYLIAKAVMAVAFSLISAGLLIGAATVSGTVNLSPAEAVQLASINCLSVMPFCALGLLVGAVLPPMAVVPVLQLFYLPLAFFSGLMIPIDQFPNSIRIVASGLPPHQVLLLGQTVAGIAEAPARLVPALILALYTLGFLALAHWRLSSRDA